MSDTDIAIAATILICDKVDKEKKTERLRKSITVEKTMVVAIFLVGSHNYGLESYTFIKRIFSS